MSKTLRVNRVLFGLFLVISSGVFVASLISPVFRTVAYAPVREAIFPLPQPIVVPVLYSTEKAAWLDEVVEGFYASNPSVDGHPIQLELTKMGSREIYLAVLDGTQQPVIISPASSLQISILQDLSTARFGAPLVNPNDRTQCRSVVTSPLVLVAWKERADALWGGDPGPDLWSSLQAALTNPQGWAAYGHSEWGYVKFSHTNPLKSNSGFQTILLLTYNYHDKSNGLTAADILDDPGYQEWFTSLEKTISNFGDSTGTYMEEIVAYGPSLYDFVTVYEATAIEQAPNAVGRYGELQVYYPPAIHYSDHPFCILDADWVTPQQEQAAHLFIDYLLSHDAQEAALLRYGFRPVDPSVSLTQPGSPLIQYAANGLRVDLPPEVELPPGNVLNTLLDFWQRNIES